MSVHIFTFFVAAVLLHGELARFSPAIIEEVFRFDFLYHRRSCHQPKFEFSSYPATVVDAQGLF